MGVVGLTQKEAEDMLKMTGVEYRIASVDKEPLLLETNYRPDRFNLHIEDGVVVKVTRD